MWLILTTSDTSDSRHLKQVEVASGGTETIILDTTVFYAFLPETGRLIIFDATAKTGNL